MAKPDGIRVEILPALPEDDRWEAAMRRELGVLVAEVVDEACRQDGRTEEMLRAELDGECDRDALRTAARKLSERLADPGDEAAGAGETPTDALHAARHRWFSEPVGEGPTCWPARREERGASGWGVGAPPPQLAVLVNALDLLHASLRADDRVRFAWGRDHGRG